MSSEVGAGSTGVSGITLNFILSKYPDKDQKDKVQRSNR